MQIVGLNRSLSRIILATSLAALSGCGDSKSKNDNSEEQFDALDYALAAEYSRLPNAVVIRVPLDGYGSEQASAASMKSYFGTETISSASDLADIYDSGRNPGHLISSLSDLASSDLTSDEATSTQSWGHWQQQSQQQMQQQMPYQSPKQAPVQSPSKGASKGPLKGIFKGKTAQKSPVQQTPVQAQYPYQGKVVQSPMQSPVQQKQCCKAKHDTSKPFFDLFKSKKPRCGAMGPVFKPRKCMAVPAQQIPVVNGPVIGGTQIAVEQTMVMNQQQQGYSPNQQQGYYPNQQQGYFPDQQQPYFPSNGNPNGQVPPVVAPGPAVTTPAQNQSQQFQQFQPRAYSNVNDNGYWGYGQAVSATYGQTRYYAYPRPACEGAAWCALVK